MKATKLLTQHHKDVAALFNKFEKTEDEGEQDELFEQIGARLAAHDAIEREIFYPACKEALGEDDDTLGEALVEHGVVEFSIYKADIADAEDLKHCVKVLADIVEHHVEEEEKELFPKVEKAMSAEVLEELGAEMEQRFAEALEEDFRAAVRANLEQVMAGALETKPSEEADDDEDDEDDEEQDDAEAPKAKKSAPQKAPAKAKSSPTKKPATKPATTSSSGGKKGGSPGKKSTARA